MNPIPYSDKLLEKLERDNIDIYRMTQMNLIYKKILYYTNSKFKIITDLSPWIKEQVNNPTQKVKDFSNTIDTGKTFDETMHNILLKVRSKIMYEGDLKNWDIEEYWQTADETVTRMKGDCEDGAILMYVIARLKGVPANRLHLMTGDVKGGGHCWLGYKPKNYPLAYVFLDWCYWFDSNDCLTRTKFVIDNKKISSDKYLSLWFLFNEEFSSDKVKYKFNNI